MQLRALAGQQIVDQRLAQKGVAKAEALILDLHQHLLGHRLAQRGQQGAAPELGDGRQGCLVERAPDGDGAGDALGVRREPLDARHERVAQALRGGAAAVESGRQQLLGEQRVALAAREQPLEQRPLGLGAEDVGQRLRQLIAVEQRQVDPPRTLQSLQLGEQRAQRVAAVQLVGAVGEEQHDALLAQAAGEEGDERARRAVGPVHVLEREYERRRFGDEVDQLEHGLEQPQLPGAVGALIADAAVVVEPGQDRGQLRPAAGRELAERRVASAHERTQRAQQRGVGQLAVGLLHPVAAEEQDGGPVSAGSRRPGAEALLEFGDDPGLANARVTAEQDERGPSGGGLLDGELQLGQLADPSHEVAARQSRPHDRSIHVGRRPRHCQTGRHDGDDELRRGPARGRRRRGTRRRGSARG